MINEVGVIYFTSADHLTPPPHLVFDFIDQLQTKSVTFYSCFTLYIPIKIVNLAVLKTKSNGIKIDEK